MVPHLPPNTFQPPALPEPVLATCARGLVYGIVGQHWPGRPRGSSPGAAWRGTRSLCPKMAFPGLCVLMMAPTLRSAALCTSCALSSSWLSRSCAQPGGSVCAGGGPLPAVPFTGLSLHSARAVSLPPPTPPPRAQSRSWPGGAPLPWKPGGQQAMGKVTPSPNS